MRFAAMILIVLCACAVMPYAATAEEVTAVDAAEQADTGPLAVSPPVVIAVPPASDPTAAPAPTTPPVTPVTPVTSSWSDLGWKVAQWAFDALCALLGFLILAFGRWLLNKTSNEALKHVITQATDAAGMAVASVQQTFVDAVIAGGGKLSVDQEKEALAKALAAVKTILGTKGMDALQSALALGQSEAEAWLVHALESKVQAAKVVAP